MKCRYHYCDRETKYVLAGLCPACFEWRRRMELLTTDQVKAKMRASLLLGERWADLSKRAAKR